MTTDYSLDLQLYGSDVDSQNKPMACRQDNHRLTQVWKVSVTQSCPTLCDPMDYKGTHQVPLSMGFSRQEYWSGLPFPSPGDLPDPGIEPISPTLQADSLPSEPPGSPNTSLGDSNTINSHMNSSQIFKNKLKRKPTVVYSRVCVCMLSQVQPLGL